MTQTLFAPLQTSEVPKLPQMLALQLHSQCEGPLSLQDKVATVIYALKGYNPRLFMHRLQLQTGDVAPGDSWSEKQSATALLFRTQSAPLRHHSSHKIAPASPSREELREFEQLLQGTHVHMPTHLQVASGTSR